MTEGENMNKVELTGGLYWVGAIDWNVRDDPEQRDPDNDVEPGIPSKSCQTTGSARVRGS